MPHIPTQVFGPLIGWLTLALIALVLLQKFAPRLMNLAVEHPGIAWPFGWLAGSTTMIANAAGPVMTIYLLACRLPKFEFVGHRRLVFLCDQPPQSSLQRVPGFDQFRQSHSESVAGSCGDRRLGGRTLDARENQPGRLRMADDRLLAPRGRATDFLLIA